jgi:hypothetical protein
VPKTLHELYSDFILGMPGFLIGFTFLMLIWHDQYLFFRRYGLRDTRTIFWTACLLFVVLFYIYPTKFLFTFVFNNNRITDHGETVNMVTTGTEMRQLMVLFGFGFTLVYFILWQTYRHAYRLRKQLSLTPLEEYIARTHNYKHLILCIIGLLSIAVAFIIPAGRSVYAGSVFNLIFPAMYGFRVFRKRKMKKLFTEEELEHNHSEPGGQR